MTLALPGPHVQVGHLMASADSPDGQPVLLEACATRVHVCEDFLLCVIATLGLQS